MDNTELPGVPFVVVSALLVIALADATPPNGWVELKDAVPGIAYDIRYASRDNFTEAVLPGYCAPRAWMLGAAANDLKAVQAELERRGLGLLVYDAYRPARGTLGMVDWATRTDQVHLLDTGYIARKSAHNKGATIDLTVWNPKTGEPVDMGTAFDTFSEASHTKTATGQALQNRLMLKAVMESHGFKNYWKEWWHYSWVRAPDTLPHQDIPYPCVTAEDVHWKANFTMGDTRLLTVPLTPRSRHAKPPIGADLDGDGKAEIVAGSAFGGDMGKQPGIVSIVRGPRTLELRGRQPGSAFGDAVAFGGDVDGDGRLDLLVGSPGYQDDPERWDKLGRAYLYASGDLMAGRTEPRVTFVPGNAIGSVGEDVFGLGDLDGDGKPEIGISGEDDTLFIFKGSRLPTSASMGISAADWTVHHDGASFWRPAAFRDRDGDGKDDLLISESEVNGTRGAAWIVSSKTLAKKARIELAVDGEPTGPGARPWDSATGDFMAAVLFAEPSVEEFVPFVGIPTTSARFTQPDGRRLDTLLNAGDLDGDGTDDLVVGTMDDGLGEMGLFIIPGSAIARGGTQSLATMPQLVVDVEVFGNSGKLQIRGARVGDLNGDGRADIGVTISSYPSEQGETVDRLDRTWVLMSPFVW